MSRDIFHQTRLLRAPSNLALNNSREGAVTASLGNLYQCFTTLSVSQMNMYRREALWCQGGLPISSSPSHVSLEHRDCQPHQERRCLLGNWSANVKPTSQEDQHGHKIMGPSSSLTNSSAALLLQRTRGVAQQTQRVPVVNKASQQCPKQ